MYHFRYIDWKPVRDRIRNRSIVPFIYQCSFSFLLFYTTRLRRCLRGHPNCTNYFLKWRFPLLILTSPLMFLHQRRWWYHHPTHPHHQTPPEIWCQWPMVGKQINGEHNKHSKTIGDYRQKRTTALGRSIGRSWIDIKCYQNIWPCDHL